MLFGKSSSPRRARACCCSGFSYLECVDETDVKESKGLADDVANYARKSFSPQLSRKKLFQTPMLNGLWFGHCQLFSLATVSHPSVSSDSPMLAATYDISGRERERESKRAREREREREREGRVSD